MTAVELGKLTREGFSAAGLWDIVDEHKSQFLEFPDGFFAEIVLKDGSKIPEAELVESDVRQSLRRQGTDLSFIVRSIWRVDEVGDHTRVLTDFSTVYPAKLVSGNLNAEVEVVVTLLARDRIKRELRESGKKVVEGTVVKEKVKEFLELQLSLGGESYWDPLRDSKRELNDSALLYLSMDRTVVKH
jgi:hypothetical protein